MSQSIAQSLPETSSVAPSATKARASSTSSKRKAKSVLFIKRFMVLVGFLGIWSIAVQVGLADAAFISTPGQVYTAFMKLLTDGTVWPHLYTTFIEVGAAFALSVAFGILAAIILDRNEGFHDVISPYLAAFNSMPRIALGPIFILWFGIGISSKVVLATSLGFFIILMSTLGGLRNVDRDMLMMSRLYGASNLKLFWFVRLPWALPSVFAGLKLTLIYCMSGAVIGEMIAAQSGLGLLLQTYSGQFDIASVLAVMLTLILVVVALTSIIDAIERKLLGWSKGSTNIPE
ncbi:MAG: ABC transporter permease [Burkholderiaceae bacterium]|nr:ABC transporter permease [Burkholderiaceae bacterium]